VTGVVLGLPFHLATPIRFRPKVTFYRFRVLSAAVAACPRRAATPMDSSGVPASTNP
jgi:hypothetical protein